MIRLIKDYKNFKLDLKQESRNKLKTLRSTLNGKQRAMKNGLRKCKQKKRQFQGYLNNLS
jgi:hypothetical protein